MAFGAISRAAVVTVTAAGLSVMALAVPLPKACAAPSPSCGGDLRECLRLSADMNPPAPFGVRYVTADQVARCMETFNSCIHGGASSGGGTPPPTSTSGGFSSGGIVPQRFTITLEGIISDCRVEGEAVNCTSRWPSPPAGYVSFEGSFAGTLSGTTLTGTTKSHTVYQNEGCTSDERYTGPASYVFSSDGTVAYTAGPNQRESSFSGSCTGSSSGTTPVAEGTATWTPGRY